MYPMPTVALATCENVHPVGAAEHPLLERALAQQGVEARSVAWTDPSADWSAFDAVIVHTTWDYPSRLAEFRAWTRRVERETKLWNPARVIDWNLHKGYLLELEAKGVRIPPTRLMRAGAPSDLAALMDAQGWARVVVKPAVGVAAIGAMLVARDEAAKGQAHLDGLLATGDALVQPYLASIATRGETSIIAFEGEPSHAVRKRPRDGDYRIQMTYGGTHGAVEATPAELELARAALAAVGEPLVYARVDLVDVDGAPALMELEVIEPYFFMHDVEQARPFAAAVAARLA